MPTLQAALAIGVPAREKQSVALVSLIAAALLTGLKLSVAC